jgi:Ser/Thr protein kinase RdoA (MazF antagonist)
VRTSASTIEPFDATTLIHGDLTFENVLWDGDAVTAIIDFEWARPAPRDLELDVLLRFCAYPFLHVADDYEAQTKAEAYEDVPSWLAEDYPQLFTARDLRDRLRIYAIAFEIRQLLMLPPSAPARELSPRHPLPRLLQLLTHRSYLDHSPL